MELLSSGIGTIQENESKLWNYERGGYDIK